MMGSTILGRAPFPTPPKANGATPPIAHGRRSLKRSWKLEAESGNRAEFRTVRGEMMLQEWTKR